MSRISPLEGGIGSAACTLVYMNNITETPNLNKHYKAGAKYMLPLAVAAIERAVPHMAPTVRSIRSAVIEMSIDHYHESVEAAEHIANFAALAWVKAN